MADELTPFISDPATAGLFLDFDGTLSEIVPIPDQARPVAGVADALIAAAKRLRLVAVVSGRSARQLLEWLGPDVEVWGVHGAERAVQGHIELTERARAFTELMSAVKEEARRALAELSLPGVILEDKGVMIGFHYRAALDRERARAALDELADELAERHGLRRAGGRLTFELRPPVEFSKAEVVLRRAREEELKAAAFIGDDRVDLPAFDALDELAQEGVHVLRVAVASDEVPDELLRRADITVEGPPGVVTLLKRLLK